MAKKVIWSELALNDLESILSYWIVRNKSIKYSKKLNERILKAVAFIGANPKAGRLSDYGSIRLKLEVNYNIVYEELDDRVLIHAIWDVRQNPIKLKNRLEK